ncbi:PD-(D/E)XK nuclease family protein [Paraburkholderia terrae]|uniref:PDDEXK-like family protein n=1 Tax=Paraburkholderia terrae TaxID=311230 RepID=UPI001EE30D17|nr:PD-(D/E)XK nuclease family protein [Paraburkholderia terrae]GJH02777.1 PD-(D/E)XK nuclease family protein [Paraburkholderia terrae]
MKREQELLELIDAVSALEREHGLVNRFNLFDAIGMARQEIRHSRFLSFLLNPAETHGLGDKFLRAILMTAVSGHPDSPVSRLAIAVTDCSKARVYCERDHFDITVEIPDLRLMFVIENKIDATEGRDQLKRYRELVESRYSEFQFLGAFLTPDGYSGEDEAWVSLNYRTLTNELRRLTRDSSLASAVSMTIHHYVEMIEKEIATSQELINACRNIYAEHKTALDLIMQHGPVPVLPEAFKEFSEKFSGKIGGLKPHTTRANDVCFVAESWLSIPGFHVANTDRWRASCPVQLWFSMVESRLYFRLEVGPVSGERFDRNTFVNELRREFSVSDRATAKALYTRIRTVSVDINGDLDVEQTLKAMEELWEKMGGNDVVPKVKGAAERCV